jgi:deoxyribonucleoside regulator
MARGATMNDLQGRDDRVLLMARIASLYYEVGLTQAEVARQVEVSRSTVSRLLDEARELGIVEVRIHHPLARAPVLERELKERFSLKGAWVLAEEGLPYDRMVRRLGDLAAEYLHDQLYAEAVLGLTWGRTVAAVVRAMRKPGSFPVHVVQLAGSVGRMGPERDGLELARTLADVLGGSCLYMRAPIIVKTAELCHALMEDPDIREALRVGEKADFAIAGIGSVARDHSTVVETGYLSSQELSELAEAGAVGDIGSRHFDAQGKECRVDLNERVIGLSLEQLRAIPRVVGVAGGSWKAQAILAALRGGLVDILVTDQATAEYVLRGGVLTT